MNFKRRLNIFENSEKFQNIIINVFGNALSLVSLYLLSITIVKGKFIIKCHFNSTTYEGPFLISLF